jgi:hypothetical protein
MKGTAGFIYTKQSEVGRAGLCNSSLSRIGCLAKSAWLGIAAD